MKKQLIRKVVIYTLLALFSISVHAADTYTLDPNHTYVLWGIKHFGFSTQVGKFYATGTLVLDKDKPENSKVNASITIASIATGLAELDKHLKGKLFFDADKFPVATFVSDKTEVIDKITANVHGTLTLHGVAKPLVLHVKLNKVGMNPISNKMTAGFSASATIKRSDFGMTTLIPGLSDDVDLMIGSEAFPATK